MLEKCERRGPSTLCVRDGSGVCLVDFERST